LCKIGGTPAWFDGPAQKHTLICKSCAEPLLLVAQVSSISCINCAIVLINFSSLPQSSSQELFMYLAIIRLSVPTDRHHGAYYDHRNIQTEKLVSNLRWRPKPKTQSLYLKQKHSLTGQLMVVQYGARTVLLVFKLVSSI
jgi:hypothetical protein